MAKATKTFLYRIGTKGAKKAENDLRGVDKSTQSLGKSAVALGAAFIAVAAALKSLTSGLSAAKLASEAKNIETAFNKFSNSVKLMESLKDAVKDTIPEIELMRTTIVGIDLGATNEQIRTFAEFARLEAVRKGSDALLIFQNIIGGVLRGSTELLDNFGISLTQLNKEIEILAEENLDKAATKLSAVERRELSVIAATNLMNLRLEKAGEIAVTDAERYTQFSASLTNLKVALGSLVSPEVASVINTITNLLNKLTESLDIFEKKALERSIASATEKLLKLNEQLGKTQRLVPITNLAKRIEEIGLQINIWQQALDKLNTTSEAVAEDGGIVEKIIGEPLKVEKAIIETATLVEEFDQLGRAMAQAAIFGQSMGESIVSALRAIAAEILAQQIGRGLISLVGGLVFGGVGGFAATSMFSGVSGLGKVSAQSPNNQTNINLNISTLIGTDEAAVRDQLVPILNRVMANA